MALDDFAAQLRADGHVIEEIDGCVYVTGMTVKNPKPDRERIIFETVACHGYEPQSEEEFFNCVIALESELAISHAITPCNGVRI